MITITICTSANFYRQAVDLQVDLEKMGYKVILPATAEKMRQSGDFDASHYRTWRKNADDYHKKADLMQRHFKEVEKADAVLVLNYEKHGIANYIGGNVLMEMSLAFFLGKPLFVLNPPPLESSFLEEILGMLPVFLDGRIADLPVEYDRITA
jgi:hypothetical protein